VTLRDRKLKLKILNKFMNHEIRLATKDKGEVPLLCVDHNEKLIFYDYILDLN
jgi:hypothetical protein